MTSIANKKQRFDDWRPLRAEALATLHHYFDLELTYTSNANEGNTLSAVETIQYARELARQTFPLTESDIRNLHRLVARRSRPDIEGQHPDLPRYVRTETGRHSFPSPAEIPPLMTDFAAWVKTAPDMPATAFDAIFKLSAFTCSMMATAERHGF